MSDDANGRIALIGPDAPIGEPYGDDGLLPW